MRLQNRYLNEHETTFPTTNAVDIRLEEASTGSVTVEDQEIQSVCGVSDDWSHSSVAVSIVSAVASMQTLHLLNLRFPPRLLVVTQSPK